MRKLSGDNLKKIHMISSEKLLFEYCNFLTPHLYFVIAIIVFSLVDKRAEFSNPEVVGSNPGLVIFFFFIFF